MNYETYTNNKIKNVLGGNVQDFPTNRMCFILGVYLYIFIEVVLGEPPFQVQPYLFLAKFLHHPVNHRIQLIFWWVSDISEWIKPARVHKTHLSPRFHAADAARIRDAGQ